MHGATLKNNRLKCIFFDHASQYDSC